MFGAGLADVTARHRFHRYSDLSRAFHAKAKSHPELLEVA